MLPRPTCACVSPSGGVDVRAEAGAQGTPAPAGRAKGFGQEGGERERASERKRPVFEEAQRARPAAP
eukprot:12033115-Alexandrium_andersonii.AAC.1